MSKINHQVKSRSGTSEHRMLKFQQMIHDMWDESWASAQTRKKEDLSISRKKRSKKYEL